MYNRKKSKISLKMKKSIVIFVSVFALSQLGNAFPTIDNSPTNTGEPELPNYNLDADINNVEGDIGQNKKTLMLLVPVKSTDENIYSQSEEEEEEEAENEEVEKVPYNSHKTKRCKSYPRSLQIMRRIPVVRNPRKYMSVSTESSIDESLENSITGESLLRVASIEDPNDIIRSLLKARTEREDSMRLLTKDLERPGKNRSKKYVCYCLEKDCETKKPGKKPSRLYAMKKKSGPNILSKSRYSTNDESQKGLSGHIGSGHLIAAPNHLNCPPGSILIEDPEYSTQLSMKQHLQRRPIKKNFQITMPCDTEAQSLEQPIKIQTPLAGNRKWNRRVYKVDRKSPFAQKLQSVIEQKEAEDKLPCPEPESSVNDAQGVQDYYNNEQGNFNQYHQIPGSPNLVYPVPYIDYPRYQFPQFPQYDAGLSNIIPLEPANQAFVSYREPSHNQYVPTRLGQTFLDIDQCIKLFGVDLCIATPPVSSVHEPRYKWQEETHYTAKSSPEEKTSRYQLNAYNADKASTHFLGLGVTRQNEENLHQNGENVEDQSEQQHDERISLKPEHNRVTASQYYSSQPLNREYKTREYENLNNPKSSIRYGNPNSEYLIPKEVFHESETENDWGTSEETDEKKILQKNRKESVMELPVITSARSSQNLQGAHKLSSLQYLKFTEKPGEEDVSTTSSENTSEESSEDVLEYVQTINESRLPNYGQSEFRYSTNEPNDEEDNSGITLQTDSQKGNGLMGWQRVTTVNPIVVSGDRKASTSFDMHGPNHRNHENAVSSKYDVYQSSVTEEAKEDFQPHIPKTTSSHRQFVGITQSIPVHHYSEPKYVSSATNGGNRHYATIGNTKYSTTSLLGAKKPQERLYTSSTYSNTNDAAEIKTDSSWLQESEEDEDASTEIVPTTLHYATPSRLGNTRYSTTSLRSAKKPQERLYTSSTYSNTNDAAEIMTDSSWLQESEEDEDASTEIVPATRHYTTPSKLENTRYSTSLLGIKKPEERLYTSRTYSNTNDAAKIKTDSSWRQENEEDEDASTEIVPTTLHYTTPWRLGKAPMDTYFTPKIFSKSNFAPMGAKTMTFPRKFVQKPQSTLTDNFSKPEFISSAKDDVNNRYTTSYSTMQDTGHSTSFILGANEPEEGIFTSIAYPMIHDAKNIKTTDIKEMPRTSFYPTRSGIQGTNIDKHFTTDKNTYPPFMVSRRLSDGSSVDGSSSAGTNFQRYLTTKKNSYPQFGTKVPEHITNNYNDAHSTKLYYSTANQQPTTSQSVHSRFESSHHSYPANTITTTTKSDLLRMPATDSSKIYWPPTAEIPERNSYSTQSKRPFAIVNHRTTTEQEDLDLTMSSEDDVYSNEDILNRYTTSELIVEEPMVTEKAYTVSGSNDNLHDEYQAPSEASNALYVPSEYMNNEKPQLSIENLFDRSGATSSVVSDSGANEESNVYLTSESYDDKIGLMTDPDSHNGGGEFVNSKDFTSMSSDESTIDDVNRTEEINEPTIMDEVVASEDEEFLTTDDSSSHTTENFSTDYSNNDQNLSGVFTEEGYREISDDGNNYSSVENAHFERGDSSAVSSTEDHLIDTGNKLSEIREGMEPASPYNVLGNSFNEENIIFSTPTSSAIESLEISESPFTTGSATSYEFVGDVLKDITTLEEAHLSSKSNEYTNSNLFLEGLPTTDSSKYEDDVPSQLLGHIQRSESTPGQDATFSTISYEDYTSSETDLPFKFTKFEEGPGTDRYDDYTEWGTTLIQEETAPILGSTEVILNEDQLSPEDRNILRTTLEKVVNDLVSVKSDERDINSPVSPDVVGAPNNGSPRLPETTILKNLFSVPEVRVMVINTVKGLISDMSDVPQQSTLDLVSDLLIDSVLDTIVENKFPGPTTSEVVDDEHGFENEQWTVVPVDLISDNDHVAQQPDDTILKTIENIVGRPGMGLRGIQLPAVQNIIVHAVESALKSAKYLADRSIIWNTLNNIIARNEKSRKASHKTMTNVRTITETSDMKEPTGSVKNIPRIPVIEHFIKDGKWFERRTILGDKRQHFESTSSTNFATDNQLRTSTSSLVIPKNEFDYVTKSADYAFMGESNEDGGFTQENENNIDVIETTKEIPTIIKTLYYNEKDLQNEPIKYYSPKDRILSYVKNHQTSERIVGSEEKLEITPDSLHIDKSTENYWTSALGISNESSEASDNFVKFAQATQANTDEFSTESKMCVCSTEKSIISDQGSSWTTKKSQRNSGEEMVSTESLENPITIYHLNVDNEGSNDDYTTDEYVANGNPSVTEEFERKTEQIGNTKSEESFEELQVLDESTDSSESVEHLNMRIHNNMVHNQIVSTPMYDYDISTERMEILGKNFDKNSEEVEALNEMTDSNESHRDFDVTEDIFVSDNHRYTDQGISKPVDVHGLPVYRNDRLRTTSSDESATQNLRQQFAETSIDHDLTHDVESSVLTISDENIGNTEFPEFLSTSPVTYLHEGDDEQSEEFATMENIMLGNAWTTDNSEENSEFRTSTESMESRESYFDVTNEDLRNVYDNAPTRVDIIGMPVQETTTQVLHRELTKNSKDYSSTQKGITLSQVLTGAARGRVGGPRFSSRSHERLDRPEDNIVKESSISSGGSSNCMTPKYDPTYFGKINLKGVNPGEDSISDLPNANLFYVGDGVKIPLSIQRMPDGSYALSISEKICENFVKRKCPCCVPHDGDIVEERMKSNEAEEEEYSTETTSKKEYNDYDSIEPNERSEFQGIPKKRCIRSTSGSEIVVTSSTPVENFVKKYNLTLNLEEDTLHPVIQRNIDVENKIKNTKRKNRLRSVTDTKIRNLFENNNEIQRDDSVETKKRAIDDNNSDAVPKESNSIRKGEYTYYTGANDYVQNLLNIKNVPEDKRTEIVLNALDGLVNSASVKNIRTMDRYSYGESVDENSWGDQSQSEGSDEYSLNKMEDEMAKYGYQKDNPILERIRFIKAQQNSQGQYKYQKNIDHSAKRKMNILKTVLHWLNEIFLETKFNNKS